MSRLRPTRNDLPETSREPVTRLLNAQLASGLHLALQAKQAHWNVRGPNFAQLHTLFDEIYDSAVAWSDLIAERAAALGGIAESTLAEVSERSALPILAGKLTSGPALLEGLAAALAGFGAGVRGAIEASEQHGDAGTADLFTEVSRGVDEKLWMVEAHISSD
jgi:starvation-inducible DNA-binding protein